MVTSVAGVLPEMQSTINTAATSPFDAGDNRGPPSGEEHRVVREPPEGQDCAYQTEPPRRSLCAAILPEHYQNETTAS